MKRRDSDLQIQQISTDVDYQSFLDHAMRKTVLRHYLPVGVIEDLLQGKVRAAAEYRPRTRQKNRAVVVLLLEAGCRQKQVVRLN